MDCQNKRALTAGGAGMKILYVCPFAHHAGHPPSAAIHEPDALAQAGAEVKLVTFYGIIDRTKVGVAHTTIIPKTQLFLVLESLISLLFMWLPLFRWLLLFCANMWTVAVAMYLQRKMRYDIIYLRDGDPFLFIPLIFSLPFRGYRWVISLMGANLCPNSLPRGNFALVVYWAAIKGLNSSFWRPFYRYSLSRNRFVFLTQSEAIRQAYSSYMQGVFSGKVICLMLGARDSAMHIPKDEARRHLNLPQDRALFLSFGASHPGKDLATVFETIANIPQAVLVQAGKCSFSVGQSPSELVRDYEIEDRVVVRDDYIAESEKPYYFFAADAVILSYTKDFTSTVSLLWDACRFNVPVIASDNGQLGELVKKFNVGLLFAAQNADSLRKTIMSFASLKPQQLEKFKGNCRAFSQELSLDNWAQNFIGVCQEVSK